jgi:aldose 1-epimerase
MNSDFISLHSGDLDAAFWPSAGMLGVSLKHRGAELLRRIDDLQASRAKGSTAGIPLLYPWANRLAALRYEVVGRSVSLQPSSTLLHFDDHGLPMHGISWGQLAWTIDASTQDSLVALLDWNRADLLDIFPFPHRLEIAATLSPDSLALRTSIVANENSPVPISFGFHPYVGLPNLKREDWHLALPQMRRLVLDPHGIPTGADEPFAALDSALGKASFDDSFALPDDQRSFSLSGAGRKITVSFLEGFHFLQVFAPAGKDFIALEPMTAPANALISKLHLPIVAAGEKFAATFRISVTSV